MSRNLTLSVLLKLTDGLSGPAGKALSGLTAQTAKAARAQRAEYQRLSQAREALGIRSERKIQQEIVRTQAAYQRLAQSGTLSWREQMRAASAMHRQVAQLANEMGRLTKMQKALAVGAAATAAAFVLKPKVEQAMAYDLRLAHIANTAFSDRDTSGRKSGMRDLNAAIVAAVRKGGGTRDQAAETLDALIASGAMSVGDSMGLLPALLKSSTATGAQSADLANIAIRGMQTFKIKPQDLPNVIDMAITAGQAGGFELRDMAKWLPQQMAAASASGLTGVKGFAKLAALNQASAITAGTKDEAGNNLVNLLTKINSRDTAQDAERMGINLPKYLAQQRMKGVDSVEAFVGLVDQTVSKQTAWKQLQEKLKGAKDESEKRDTLESMASIVQGSGIGKLVQDRQALMALVGIMNNRQYLADVQQKTLGGRGAGERNFALISDTAAFKTGQLGNEKEIAQQAALDKLNPAIGGLSEKTVELARQYPGLTTATVAATTALTALAAAAGAAALASGGGVGGISGKVAGAARGAGGLALRAAPLVAAGAFGYGVGSYLNEGISWGISKLTSKDSSLGTWLYDLTHDDEWKKINGEIRVKVDQDGRVTSVHTTTANPNIPLRVDAGRTMVLQ